MLLQDISIDKLNDSLDPKLLSELKDIVHNVHIKDNFCISHPSYKPLELPAESIERLHNISPDLQQKYMSSQLRSFIYGIHYNRPPAKVRSRVCRIEIVKRAKNKRS